MRVDPRQTKSFGEEEFPNIYKYKYEYRYKFKFRYKQQRLKYLEG